jgi:internalin A
VALCFGPFYFPENLKPFYNKAFSNWKGLILLKMSLKHINLSGNKIGELPEKILNLELDMDVDSEFTPVEHKCIFLRGNPLEKPPLEIVRKGREAIKAYFESLRIGKTLPLNIVKVLLVGDGGAGKTSLVKGLLGQEFDINEAQTHGINIDTWTVKAAEKKIKVNIWDFGGQEIMHATHQFFLSRRSLYILVLDGRKDEKTEYWLKHIESFGGDSPVLVVINKIDENPGFEVNRKFLQEKYKNIKSFYRVSCKTKEGIDSFALALKKALS